MLRASWRHLGICVACVFLVSLTATPSEVSRSAEASPTFELITVSGVFDRCSNLRHSRLMDGMAVTTVDAGKLVTVHFNSTISLVTDGTTGNLIRGITSGTVWGTAYNLRRSEFVDGWVAFNVRPGTGTGYAIHIGDGSEIRFPIP